jgi:glycosyltransferase involved in cell wall biosynthesis
MGTVRVAHFIDHLQTGGAQKHLLELVRALDRRRFSADVWTVEAGGELVREFECIGVRVRSLALQRSLLSPYALASVMQAAMRLRREKVHIVHSYLFAANIVGTLAARLAGVPIRLVSKRSLDRYPSKAKLLACQLGNRFANRITVNAKAVGDFVKQEEGCQPEKMVLIPNGVDFSRVQRCRGDARAALGLAAHEKVVGTVGRLTWKKAPECLLAAARHIVDEEPNTRVLIVGDGELRAQVEQQAVDLGIHSRCIFTGGVSDALPYLLACDVFVLSSVIEGMANALLEALACGRPAVVTDAGGNGEVVQDGRTGYVVPRNDPPRLAQATLRLLRDPELASQMGKMAVKDMSERFSLSRMVNGVEALYAELLGEKGHTS